MTRTTESLEEAHHTLTDHLAELRDRLIKALWFIILGTAACYKYSDQIFTFIRGPIAPYLPTGGLVFTAPMDKFIAHLKIAFFGGVILACPFWLYQVWKFVAPGLYSKEKKYALGFIVAGSVLFIGGICFAYFVVFPAAFHFLMLFGGDIDKPMITITEYMSFFVTTAALFGVSFELPLIIVILGMLGIVSQKFLREKRRYAIVLLAIMSAVFTPPDLLSMLFMLVPMVLLYEISILIVGVFEKKRAAESIE